MTDPVFPLYSVTFVFDRGDGTEPETTSLMRPWMFETDPGADEVERQAREAWPKLTWRTDVDVVRRLVRIEVTRKDDVPWALGWFSHQTFRVGRTDDELHESFERWVSRWERYQDYSSLPDGIPCLMGAEDRYRWRPFCDCETCRKNGIALIAH